MFFKIRREEEWPQNANETRLIQPQRAPKEELQEKKEQNTTFAALSLILVGFCHN